MDKVEGFVDPDPKPAPKRWQESDFWTKVKEALKEERTAVQMLRVFIDYYDAEERIRENLIRDINKIYDGL